MQGKVIKAYQAAYSDPIKFKAGDRIKLGKRDDEFPGWIWGSNESDKEGWIPISYLDIDGKIGVAKCDYNALELTVAVGTILEILSGESGWFYCKMENGKTGWIPENNVHLTK